MQCNGGSKAPIHLSGRGRCSLVYIRPGVYGLGIVPEHIQSRTCNNTKSVILIKIKLALGNVVMEATDMYRKNPYGTTVNGFQSLLVVTEGFVWVAVVVPDPPFLLYFFNVN